MNKNIYKYEDIKDEIKTAVGLIADPIKQTLSPMGSNVLYENEMGDQFVTNDGVTIAKNIFVEDPLHNAVIEVIKQPALQTNSTVGDGTTTSILFSQAIIDEGMKLLDDGMNKMVLKQNLEDMGDVLKSKLKTQAKELKGAKDIVRIAEISANNDRKIASDVARVIEVAGLDGMVFLEPHNKTESEIVEDTGFNINSPLMADLSDGQFSLRYDNIPTLVTDKRIYYKQEAETILKIALRERWNQVAIVARDFIGEAPNFFIANHGEQLKVLLIKDPECTEKDNTSDRLCNV
jgi:chaperonin GroEL